MPIYEYKCKKCDAQFDALQRIGEDGSNLNCPDCGEQHPEKLLSVFASSDNEGSLGGSCSADSGFT
ncbi:zinc ribbon domain-containing protein [candidate division KSB1 bacterium]|nr:zinc ribbon domain-containing protein [candidate division KSB1 bacterium]